MTQKKNRYYKKLSFYLIIGFLLLCLLPAVSSGILNPELTLPTGNPTSNPTSGSGIGIVRCPNPFVVVMQANPPSIKTGESSSITIKVTNSSQTPISSSNITITISGGNVKDIYGITDKNGNFLTNFTSKYAGTFFVNATVTTYKSCRSIASTQIIVSQPAVVTLQGPLSVSIDSDPASVEPNKISVLIVTVTGKDGKPVSGANVTLNSTQEGTIGLLSGQTNSLGKLTSNFTGSREGNATITAHVEKTGFAQGVQNITIKITGTHQDLLLNGLVIAVILLILLVAIVLVYLWTRSIFQLTSKQKTVPCDGKSTIALRAQFVNGFGSLKKQRSDREIHLETTAGKIQDVIILAGKEYGDATLTSSQECGTVTITATTGHKNKATAQVQFVGDAMSIEVDISPTEIPADGNSTATIILKIKDRNGIYLTYLEEKIINLTATLGTLPAFVKIEPKAMSGTTTITSGDKKGIALIQARMDEIVGEGKIQFKELGRRYCMHCGEPMEMEAPSCPKCGKIAPSGVDTKQCSTCNSVLPLSAKFCDKCGARQPV